MVALIRHIHYGVFCCPCSQDTQWVQLVLCSSSHFDCHGVCMGAGSDCSMTCAVDATWMQFQVQTPVRCCKPLSSE